MNEATGPGEIFVAHQGFAAILPNLGILIGLSAVLSVLAARYFKIRD